MTELFSHYSLFMYALYIDMKSKKNGGEVTQMISHIIKIINICINNR